MQMFSLAGEVAEIGCYLLHNMLSLIVQPMLLVRPRFRGLLYVQHARVYNCSQKYLGGVIVEKS